MGGMDSPVRNAHVIFLFILCLTFGMLLVRASDDLATTEETDGFSTTSSYIVTPSDNPTTEGADELHVNSTNSTSDMPTSSEIPDRLSVGASDVLATTEGTNGLSVTPSDNVTTEGADELHVNSTNSTSDMLTSSEIRDELLAGAPNATDEQDRILMDESDIDAEELDGFPGNASDSMVISDQPEGYHLGDLVVIPYNNETTTSEPYELLESTTPIYEMTTTMTTTTEEPAYTLGPIRFSRIQWSLYKKLPRYYCTAGEWCELKVRHLYGKREYGLDANGKVKILHFNPKRNYSDVTYSGIMMKAVDSVRQIDVPYENTTIFKMIRLKVQNAIPWRTTHMMTLDVYRPTCRGITHGGLENKMLKQFATALGGDIRNLTLHRQECYNKINRYYLSNHTLHTGIANKKDVCALEQKLFPERYDNNDNITSLQDRMKGFVVKASMSTEWPCGEYVVVGGKATRVAGTLNLDKYDTMPEMVVTEMPPNATLSVSEENFQKLKTFECVSGEYCRMMISLTIGDIEIGTTAGGNEGVLKIVSKRKLELKKVFGAYFFGKKDFAQPIAVRIANATIFKMIRVQVLQNLKPEPSHHIELEVREPNCSVVNDEAEFNHLMKNVSVALHTPTTSLTVDSLSCKNNKTVLVFHKNPLAYSCDKKSILDFFSHIKVSTTANNDLEFLLMEKMPPNIKVTKALLHFSGPCLSFPRSIASVLSSETIVNNSTLIACLFLSLVVVFGLLISKGVAAKKKEPEPEILSESEITEITESETTNTSNFPYVDQDKESLRDPLEFGKFQKFFGNVDHNVKIHVV